MNALCPGDIWAGGGAVAHAARNRWVMKRLCAFETPKLGLTASARDFACSYG